MSKDCQHGVHSVAPSSVPPIRKTASVGHASTCAGHSNAGIAFSLQMSHVSVFLWQMGIKDYGGGEARDMHHAASENTTGGEALVPMVWAGISGHSRTQLVVTEGNLTAERYINLVLAPIAIPFLELHPHVHLLQGLVLQE